MLWSNGTLAAALLGLYCLFTLPVTVADNQVKAAAKRQYVQLDRGYLSVEVKNMPTLELVQEIARQGGFILKQTVPISSTTSLTFQSLPLSDGLRRILRNKSFALQYHSSGSGSSRLKVLWLFHQETGRGMDENQTLGMSGIGFSSRQYDLDSSNVEDQKEAIALLGDNGLPRSIAPLSLVLLDGDDELQESAIAALADIGGDAAVHALAIALVDPLPAIREEAIYALGEIGGELAVQYLLQALMDEHESVRLTAEQILEEL